MTNQTTTSSYGWNWLSSTPQTRKEPSVDEEDGETVIYSVADRTTDGFTAFENDTSSSDSDDYTYDESTYCDDDEYTNADGDDNTFIWEQRAMILEKRRKEDERRQKVNKKREQEKKQHAEESTKQISAQKRREVAESKKINNILDLKKKSKKKGPNIMTLIGLNSTSTDGGEEEGYSAAISVLDNSTMFTDAIEIKIAKEKELQRLKRHEEKRKEKEKQEGEQAQKKINTAKEAEKKKDTEIGKKKKEETGEKKGETVDKKKKEETVKKKKDDMEKKKKDDMEKKRKEEIMEERRALKKARAKEKEELKVEKECIRKEKVRIAEEMDRLKKEQEIHRIEAIKERTQGEEKRVEEDRKRLEEEEKEKELLKKEMEMLMEEKTQMKEERIQLKQEKERLGVQKQRLREAQVKKEEEYVNESPIEIVLPQDMPGVLSVKSASFTICSAFSRNSSFSSAGSDLDTGSEAEVKIRRRGRRPRRIKVQTRMKGPRNMSRKTGARNQEAFRDQSEGRSEESFEGDDFTRVDESSVGEESYEGGDDQSVTDTKKRNTGLSVIGLMSRVGRRKKATDLDQTEAPESKNSVETEPVQIENKLSIMSSDDEIEIKELAQRVGIELASSLQTLSNEAISFLYGMANAQETMNKNQLSPEESVIHEVGSASDNSSREKVNSTAEEREITPGDSNGIADHSSSNKKSGRKIFRMSLKKFLRKKEEAKNDFGGSIEQREDQEMVNCRELEDERDRDTPCRENTGIRDAISYDPEEIEVEEVSVYGDKNKPEDFTMVSGTRTKNQVIRKEIIEAEKSKLAGMGFMARAAVAGGFMKGAAKKLKKKKNKRAPLFKENLIQTPYSMGETSEQVPNDITFKEKTIVVDNGDVKGKTRSSSEETGSSTTEGKDPSMKEKDINDNVSIAAKSIVSRELQRKAKVEAKNIGLIFSAEGLRSDSSWEDDESIEEVTPRKYARMYLNPALSRDRSNPENLKMLHSLARSFSFGSKGSRRSFGSKKSSE